HQCLGTHSPISDLQRRVRRPTPSRDAFVPYSPRDGATRQDAREQKTMALSGPHDKPGRIVRAIAAVVAIFAFFRAFQGADLGRAFATVLSIGAPVFLGLVPQALWTLLHAFSWRRILASLGHRVAISEILCVTFSTEAVLATLPAGAALAESTA